MVSEAPEILERYTVALPQNAARVLEWLASGDGKAPEDYIQETLLGCLRQALTHLDDARAADLLTNKGIPGEWDWRQGENTKIEASIEAL